MKRLVLTLAVALVTALSASAQRLANIQVEARFITDKMVLGNVAQGADGDGRRRQQYQGERQLGLQGVR